MLDPRASAVLVPVDISSLHIFHSLYRGSPHLPGLQSQDFHGSTSLCLLFKNSIFFVVMCPISFLFYNIIGQIYLP